MRITKKWMLVVMLVAMFLTLLPTLSFAAASGPPGTPVLTQNNWDSKPNYSLTFNMWWGNNGTTWKLYENGTLIHTADLTDNTPNAQTGSYSFTNKASGTYVYKVELINAAGTSVSNNLSYTVAGGTGGGDTQAPTTPTNLTSTAKTATTIDLTWSAATDNVGVTGYEVFKDGVSVGTTPNTAFSVTGLTANTAYAFTVKAKDAAGNVSLASNSLSVTTDPLPVDTQAPSAPSNLITTAKTSTSIALSWSPSTDNVGVTGYNIFKDGVSAGTTTSTTFNATALSPNTAYVFTVQAKDAAGNVSALSNSLSVTTDAASSIPAWTAGTAYKTGDRVSYKNSVYICLQAHTALVGWEPSGTPTLWQLDTSAPDTTPPTAPTALTVSTVSSNALTLSWQPSTDNIGVKNYTVFQNGTSLGTSTNTSYLVTGLSANSTYVFSVKASDAAGNVSAASNEVTVTTPAPDLTPPTAPTNLTASNVTSNTVVLTWNASTDNVAVSGYDIYAGPALKGSTTGTSYTVTGLSPTTLYSFTVKAKDAAGNISDASNPVSVTTLEGSKGGDYKIVGYFPSWGVYSGRNYKVPDIDASKVTHINFAFADICWNGKHGNPDPTGPNPTTWSCQDENGNINVPNGTIVQGDPWADTGMSYPGDTWDTPIKGSFNQLNKLKKAYPHLKTIISVGGWSWSNRFSDVAADPAARKVFAKSAVDFIHKYGFDGVDLDWEYPVGGGLAGNSARPADKQNYTLLLQEIRTELDLAGAKDGKHYYLTIASGISAQYQNNTELDKIAQICDWINMMAYDMHGAWDPKSGQNAPLYFDPADNGINPTDFNIDAAIKGYLAKGVPANKIVLGLAFYGRGWDGCANVNGGLYQTCSGGSKKGTVEAGSFDYWDLEANYINKNGYTRYWNDVTKTPYLYNPSTGTFITYDDVQSLQFKTDYLKAKGLAGGMFWEFSGDKTKTLLRAVSDFLPRQSLSMP
ncbi:glycosyl hydrolase family 18 protein [Paenibacillus guangzhouensis]|uniref:glycosyl hydrolase family 18 protein n=1 Tax=Paenibacillus guangzhouensis TaxID=1473112 RepID=UPI00187B77C0|nr:glycosyl hydrolase family 18 protein [Paenibacillus guangzhouensis]